MGCLPGRNEGSHCTGVLPTLKSTNANVLKERKKTRWEHEEMVLLARKEIEARAAGKVNVKKSAEAFPDRTCEAIKGVRKGATYKELLLTLRTSDGTQDGAPSMQSEERTQDWAAGLIKGIGDSGIVLGEHRLEHVVPGQSSDQDREAVDNNYEVWLPSSRWRRSQSAREPRTREPEGARG